MARVGARRLFNDVKIKNGIDANEGVPIARIKARYTEQGPLTRNMIKPCQQGRCANGSSLLNIGAKKKDSPHKRVSGQVLPKR